MNTKLGNLKEALGLLLLVFIVIGFGGVVIYEIFITKSPAEEDLFTDLKTTLGVLLLVCSGGFLLFLVNEFYQWYKIAFRSAATGAPEGITRTVQKYVGWRAQRTLLLSGTSSSEETGTTLESPSVRQGGGTERSVATSPLHAQDSERLEQQLSQNYSDIAELKRSLNELREVLYKKNTETARLADTVCRLEGAYSSLSETSEKEREALLDRLVEAERNTNALTYAKASLEREITRVKGEVETLKRGHEAHRLARPRYVREAFQKVFSLGVGRLRNALSGAMHPRGRQLGATHLTTFRERSAAAMRLTLSNLQQGMGGTPANTALALLLSLALPVTVWIPIKGDMPRLTDVVTQPRPLDNWAEGTKQTRNGGYIVTVSFLDGESLSALERSKEMRGGIAGEKRYARLEIQADGKCIPDRFVSESEERIHILDESGNEIPYVPISTLRDIRRIIYKLNACGNRRGVVYMKDVISIGKDVRVNGIAIGLDERSAIVLR